MCLNKVEEFTRKSEALRQRAAALQRQLREHAQVPLADQVQVGRHASDRQAGCMHTVCCCAPAGRSRSSAVACCFACCSAAAAMLLIGLLARWTRC
jgi:hypothetical protein